MAASFLADRLRLPALVLFLAVGMAIGTDGLGWIDFEDYQVARFIGTVALLLILFEGGLAAGWPVIRPVLRPALSLALVATTVTAVVTGLAAMALFDLSLRARSCSAPCSREPTAPPSSPSSGAPPCLPGWPGRSKPSPG